MHWCMHLQPMQINDVLSDCCQGVGLPSVADLHVRQDDEGCVPALQHEDNSNRPFETVEELAKESLGEYVLHYMHMNSGGCVRHVCSAGMNPKMGDDTVASGGIFNNKFTQKHRAVGSF